jgi:4'-phosphopantetheinyl transferase
VTGQSIWTHGLLAFARRFASIAAKRRHWSGMVNWIENLSDWDRRIPAAFIASGLARDQRRALPRSLVAHALGLALDAVAVEQPDGRPPVVTEPVNSGLCLSAASRGPFTAVVIAASPIGVDVELVDPAGEIPWNVLQSSEAAVLSQLEGYQRAAVFARLWSLKEAYLKAIGIGLFREPSSFAVDILDAKTAIFDDPHTALPIIEAASTWRTIGATRAAISTVILGDVPEPERAGSRPRLP